MYEQRRAWIKELLWVVALAGLVAAALRLVFGLGLTTGLNDANPWGLWIAFKLGFVALAGGGFTIAALVYIFHLDSYHFLARRAILLAMLGYGAFILSLLLDLGLPWHIYMPVFHWQHHSVMFEIAWCVMLYFSVLLLEFSPSFLEHPRLQQPVIQKFHGILRKAILPIVIAGIALSTLHQSSLGSLFLIMPNRVHPLWYSPWIPILFFTSAISAGIMALVLEGSIAERFFGHKMLLPPYSRLALMAGIVLTLYLALRLGDLLWRGILPSALDFSWPSLLFLAEIILGCLIPMMLLFSPRLRQNRTALITAALLVTGGIITQRMALSMFTMWRPQGVSYFPSLLEIVIAFAIPAAAGLLYLFFTEKLAILENQAPLPAEIAFTRPEFSDRTLVHRDTGLRSAVSRRSGLAVLAAAFVIAALPATTSGQPARSTPVRSATGWDSLVIDGNRQFYKVAFPHAAHQERLASELPDDEQACRTCHHLPGDQAMACSNCHREYYSAVSIFDHSSHQQLLGGNQACQQCHTGEHTRASAIPCQHCHSMMTLPDGPVTILNAAPGYLDAMHGACQDCHQEQAHLQQKPELADCIICHPADQPPTIQAIELYLKEANQ